MARGNVNEITLSYPTPAKGRVPVFDELRGLAILMVLMYHVGGVTGFPNLAHGDVGVDIFVLLSGAALTLSHRPQEGAFVFLGRRLARLLPAYWIALSLFWLGAVQVLGRVHSPIEVISHYLCIHPWWGDRFVLSMVDSFWFLGFIVPLYIVYAVLRRWLDRMDIVVGVGLILSFALTYFTAKVANQPATFVHLGLRPPMFFAGLIFGTMLRDGAVQLRLSGWIGFGVLLTWYGTFCTGLLIGYNLAGFAVFFAYFAVRANQEAAGRRLLCRGFAWLGLYSYEIFLLHQPLIREYNWWAWNKFGGAAPTTVQLAIGVVAGLALTLVLSVGLHHLAGAISRRIEPRRAKF